MPQKTLWQCPACKREFAKRNQWHSCDAKTVDSHFQGKPAAVEALFRELREKLETFGPLRIDAVKSSINLVAKHHFGGVHVLKGSEGPAYEHSLTEPRP